MRPLRPDSHRSHTIAVTPGQGPLAVVRRVMSIPQGSGMWRALAHQCALTTTTTAIPLQQGIPNQEHHTSLLGRLFKVLDP